MSGRKKENNVENIQTNDGLSRKESVEVWAEPPVRPVQWSLTDRVIASTPGACSILYKSGPRTSPQRSRCRKSVLCLTVGECPGGARHLGMFFRGVGRAGPSLQWAQAKLNLVWGPLTSPTEFTETLGG